MLLCIKEEERISERPRPHFLVTRGVHFFSPSYECLVLWGSHPPRLEPSLSGDHLRLNGQNQLFIGSKAWTISWAGPRLGIRGGV